MSTSVNHAPSTLVLHPSQLTYTRLFFSGLRAKATTNRLATWERWGEGEGGERDEEKERGSKKEGQREGGGEKEREIRREKEKGEKERHFTTAQRFG